MLKRFFVADNPLHALPFPYEQENLCAHHNSECGRSSRNHISRSRQIPARLMMELYVDADACPVKDEAYRVAARHNMPTYVVACQQMRDPGAPGVTMIVVPAGPDIADDWIAEKITAGDICITDDIPLAARCVKKGALVLNGRGRLLHQGNIGETLATRDLLDKLRGDGTLPEGAGAGGPAPFTKRDRSRFLEQMELAVRRIQREREAL